MKKIPRIKNPGRTFDPYTAWPNDHPHVKLLLDVALRLIGRGAAWAKVKPHNPVSATMAFQMGWAFALAAAWLRAKLSGELEPEKSQWTEIKSKGDQTKKKRKNEKSSSRHS